MSKKLIVFGAGASFGSEKNNMPPLGNFLFNKLTTAFPDSWGLIDPKIATVFQNNFEEGMEKLANKCYNALTKIQIDMAKFFVKFEPTNENLYVKLAKKIYENKWNGSIATLNYDRLLQTSIPALGLRLKLDHGIFPEIQVCYPHGCCTFFCKGITATKGVTMQKRAFKFDKNSAIASDGGAVIGSTENAALRLPEGGSIGIAKGGKITFGKDGEISGGTYGIEISGKLKVVNSFQDFSNEIQNAIPPVMSYFIPSKYTTSCTNVIDNERRRFSNLISGADDIVIIGMKVRKTDKHIWDPISQTSAKITYCAGDDGKEYFEWAEQNRPNYQTDSIMDGYWEKNFSDICSVLGL